MRSSEESCESAELNADHGQIGEGLGAGFGGFVIAHQTAVTHQPAKSALDHPAPRQHGESFAIIRALDDLHFQVGPDALDPLGKGRSAVAAIHPHQDAARQKLAGRAARGFAPRRVPGC